MIDTGKWYSFTIEKITLERDMEIDYDKLANAIVAAQKRVAADEQAQNNATSKPFVGFVAFFLRGLAIVSLPGIILLGVHILRVVDDLALEGYLATIIKSAARLLLPLIGFVAGSYAVLLWKAAKEIEIEKDKNYIVSVFSGLVSFAALIIALVALFQGVS